MADRDGGDTAPRRRRGSHRRAGRPQVTINTGFATLRDLASFGVGLYIVIHEVSAPSVELLSMGAGLSLMGLPFALAADERRKDPPDDQESA